MYFIFAFLLNGISLITCQTSFLEQPKNTSALIGSNVTLNCLIKELDGEVTWCKDSFCTFGNRKRNVSETSRFSIVGDTTKGEYNLYIRNLSIHDDALYQCQVTASEKSIALKSTSAWLNVLVAPKSVKISENIKDNKQNVKLFLRDNSTLECIADDSSPAVNINWYLNGALIKADPEVLEITQKSEKGANKLFKTTGKLLIRAFTDSKWNEKVIKCEAINEATQLLKLDSSDAKILQVKYSPILSIRTPLVNEIIDGEYVQFECVADSRPPVTNFKWSIDTTIYASGPNERFLTLKIYNASMHRKVLKCEATNEVSTQIGNYTLDIIYGPKFSRQLPSHKLVALKDTLHLICEVSSNPQSQIVWKHNDALVYSINGNLTVPNMREFNYGMYTCEASLKNFPIILSHVKVIPPGAPIIQVDHVQYAYFDSSVIVECYTEVEPRATQITWYKEGNILNVKSSKKYRTNTAEFFNQNSKHILTIIDFEPEDFSNYTCVATNEYGSSQKNIELLPKQNPLANFLVFFTIISFSVITLCIITGCLVFKYFKKNPRNFSFKTLNPLKSIETWLEDKADLLFTPKKKKRKQSRSQSLGKVQAKLVTFVNPYVSHSSHAQPLQYASFNNLFNGNDMEESIHGTEFETHANYISQFIRSHSDLRIDSNV